MRIAVLYRTTRGPWGGANAFLRSLKKAWASMGVEVLERLDSRLDGVLVNSSYLGPGRLLCLRSQIRVRSRASALRRQ
jgi:hypothetical protein